MYILDSKKIEIAKNFIDSLPESIVKGNYQRWLDGIKENGRIMSEQWDTFISLSHALPVEFQNFPQAFIHSVKNDVEMDGEVTVEEKTAKVKSKKK